MKVKHGESTVLSRRVEREKIRDFTAKRLKEIRVVHLSRKGR